MSFTPPEVAWGALAPVAVVLGAGVLGVLVEAFVPARARRWTQFGLTMVALAAAGVALAALWPDTAASAGGGVVVLGGSMILDRPALLLQALLVLLGLLSALVMADRTDAGQDAFAPSGAAVPGSDYERVATARGLAQTEVFPLMLFALGGMMIFPAAGDLLTLFVALEVLSLPLYLLTGLARRRRLLSQEASMKYFLLGRLRLGDPAVRHRAALRVLRLGQAVGDRGRGRDHGRVRPAAHRRPRHGDGRPAVQGRRGAVPLLDPGRVPGRADPGDRVHGGVHQGRGVRRPAAAGLRGRGPAAVGPHPAALGDRGADHGGRDRDRTGPDGRQAAARVLLDRARRVRAGGRRGAAAGGRSPA